MQLTADRRQTCGSWSAESTAEALASAHARKTPSAAGQSCVRAAVHYASGGYVRAPRADLLVKFVAVESRHS
eukprot:6204777-Pleurochrysis_carterae.AAC.7